MKISFSERAWDGYLYWQTHDTRMLKRINALIKETSRTPFEGTGKPEPLRNELSGWWSRRIDQEHRFVYRVTDTALEIIQCRLHY